MEAPISGAVEAGFQVERGDALLACVASFFLTTSARFQYIPGTGLALSLANYRVLEGEQAVEAGKQTFVEGVIIDINSFLSRALPRLGTT